MYKYTSADGIALFYKKQLSNDSQILLAEMYLYCLHF